MRCCEMFFGCSQSQDQRYQRHPTGNQAFEEYRADTLRNLEDEARDLHDFLDHLRAAKDKQEFDDFLAHRRAKPESV
jgi:Protein of unknown function (DUF2852)